MALYAPLGGHLTMADQERLIPSKRSTYPNLLTEDPPSTVPEIEARGKQSSQTQLLLPYQTHVHKPQTYIESRSCAVFLAITRLLPRLLHAVTRVIVRPMYARIAGELFMWAARVFASSARNSLYWTADLLGSQIRVKLIVWL